jgi:hypothetical protein
MEDRNKSSINLMPLASGIERLKILKLSYFTHFIDRISNRLIYLNKNQHVKLIRFCFRHLFGSKTIKLLKILTRFVKASFH